MKYWDASALVALLVEESASSERKSIFRDNPVVATWWGSRLECESALTRRWRERILSGDEFEFARRRLLQFSTSWHEIAPSEQVRAIAGRMLRVHPLRAADALQLASALVAFEMQADSNTLVTGDARLARAARLEGFRVA